MLERRVALLGTFVVVAIAMAILGCSMKEDKAADLKNDGAIPNTGIPPIDAAVAKRTETATFALG